MIVVGDVLDKGPESIKLLQYVLREPNIFLVLGNHEFDFLKFYHGVMEQAEEGFDEQALLSEIRTYFPPEEAALTWEDLDRLEACPFYFETDEYLCVHAGVKIDADGHMIHPKDTAPEYLVYDRAFKNPNVIPDNEKCVFFGHTPTRYLTGRDEILLYPRTNSLTRSIRDYYKIHLDCGSYLGKTLGCFSVDLCRAYYVHLSE